MKYVVHWGYYECNGLEVFNSEKSAKAFIEKEKKPYMDKAMFWARMYKTKTWEKVELNTRSGK